MKRLSKFLTVSSLLVALVLSVAVSGASAQAPTAYYTGIQIVNTSTTDEANVVVEYYNQDGTGASSDPGYSQGLSIPAGQSKTIILSLNSDLSADILAPAPAIRGLTSFVGNVVIYSDQEILSIANEAASVNNPFGSASHVGFSVADLSDVFYAPMITQLGQPNTTINIQNPNASSVSVVVDYVSGVYGNDYTAPAAVVPANGSAIWEVPAPALDGTGRFLGSAKITSTGGDVALVVDAIFAASAPYAARYNARQSYNAFKGGASEVVVPLIQKNDNGVWYVGVQIMNLGPGSATVRVTYNGLEGTGTDTACIPNAAASGLTEPDFVLAENGSKTILTEFGGALDSVALAALDCFRGAASIEVVSGTGKVAAVVSVAGQDLPDTAVYRSFDPAVATDTVAAPLIQKYLGVAGWNGWCTGVQVANLGGTAADITGTFKVTCDGTPETVVDTALAVPSNSSVTFLQVNGFATGSLGTRKDCIGFAIFTSDASQPIVATVNQTWFGSGNPFTGDVLLAYEAFNQ